MSSQHQKTYGSANLQKIMENNYTGSVGIVGNVDNYYYQYADFLARLATTFRDIQEFHEDQSNKYEDAAVKAQRDAHYTGEAEEFLQLTTTNLAKETKYMDELRAKMKETLLKVDAKKLSQLKVTDSDQLSFFFGTFFAVFYKETEEQFRWPKFKKEVILKDNMEEFQSRLVNADFSAFTDHDIALLSKLKEDPWIQDFVIKRREGEALLELVNYLEFLDEAVKTNTEIKQMQKNVAKIKRDMPIRTENAKAQVVHAEILKQNSKHLKEVHDLFMNGVQAFQNEIKASMEVVNKFGLNRIQAAGGAQKKDTVSEQVTVKPR